MNCGGSRMSICLFTEVKWQWAMLVLEWVTALVHFFDGLPSGTSRPKPLSALFYHGEGQFSVYMYIPPLLIIRLLGEKI